MFTELSDEQRQALSLHGTPLPVLNEKTGQPYLLVPVIVSPDPLGGVRAEIDSISAVGGGDTPEDAVLALTVVLQSLLRP